MTPAQFAACSDVYDREKRYTDAQFSYVRMILAEPHRDRKKRNKPYTLDDFSLFSEKALEEAEKKPNLSTPESQKTYVEQFLHPFLVARAKIVNKIVGEK